MERKYEPSNVAVKAKALLDNDVVSKEGNEVGEVDDIYIHPDRMEIEGISVNLGWFRKPLFIDQQDIKRLERGTVVLDVIPMHQIEGKNVLDQYGEMVGTVEHVRTEGGRNHIVNIVVKRKGDTNLIIAGQAITSIGKDVVVNGRKHKMASRYKTA